VIFSSALTNKTFSQKLRATIKSFARLDEIEKGKDNGKFCLLVIFFIISLKCFSFSFRQGLSSVFLDLRVGLLSPRVERVFVETTKREKQQRTTFLFRLKLKSNSSSIAFLEHFLRSV
jgi:hypothetical protein